MASRVESLEPEGAYKVLAAAQAMERAGRDIVHLEIGEPDFVTDENICRAGIEAIEAGKTRYNPTSGILPLREAIAADASRRRGIEFKAEKIIFSSFSTISKRFNTSFSLSL